MNSVEQVAGSYGRFSYDADKQRNGAGITQDFEALIGGHADVPVAAGNSITVEERIAGEVPDTIPTGDGVVLYLYNFLGEATRMEPKSGVNVNKLV